MLRNLIDLDRLSLFWDNVQSYIDNKKINVDNVPTLNSKNPVSSGGVYTALQGKADTEDVPTKLSDLTDDATHRTVTDTEKSTWNGKATTTDITNAINALDVSSVGGTGKYISAISEADGKISATAETMDEVPTQDSNKTVKSGGVFSAIDDSVSLKSATGNPITLTDAANANAEELSMTIEPIQSGSGDPSPTNVRPISGLTEGKVVACGKNLFDKTNYLDKTYIDTTTGELVVEQNAGWITTPLINIGGVSSLTMQGNKVLSQGAVRYRVLDYDKNIISVVSLTRLEIRETNTFTNLNGFYFQMCFRNENGAVDACQIEEGSTATEYEPYTAATATITFGQTVYGGSVNFKTGEVTVTHGYVKVSDLTWQTQESVYAKFYAVVPNLKYVDDEVTAISDIYVGYSNGGSTAKPRGVDGIYVGAVGTGWVDKAIKVYDATYASTSDVNAWKAARANNVFCYELATPTTLTLTPAELELLKGNNTITANGAEISIEYYPDNAIGALAGRVDGKADNAPTFTEASTRANIASGETISTLFGKIKKYFTDLEAVAFSGSYSDLTDKPTIPTDYIADSLKGAANGVAELDSNGKVPASQLPSYVDDVLEYTNKASFPATGETGKIYIDKATNKTYRWSGTAYVEISESLALGETSSTAYAGNKGKANADAIATLNGTGAGSVSKAVSDAIGALDVSSVGGSGKYISAISETDGKISATAANMPTSLPASDVYAWAKASTKPSYSYSEITDKPTTATLVVNPSTTPTTEGSMWIVTS